MEFKYTHQSARGGNVPRMFFKLCPQYRRPFGSLWGRREMSDKNEKWVIKKRVLFML